MKKLGLTGALAVAAVALPLGVASASEQLHPVVLDAAQLDGVTAGVNGRLDLGFDGDATGTSIGLQRFALQGTAIGTEIFTGVFGSSFVTAVGTGLGSTATATSNADPVVDSISRSRTMSLQRNIKGIAYATSSSFGWGISHALYQQ